MNQDKKPQTTIIVPTYGNEEYTIRCFDSIIKNTDNYQIIWVDDASSNESVKRVKEFLDAKNISYKLIRNKKNLGFIKSVNKGINLALNMDSKYVVLQNNDTEVFEDWLKIMINVAEDDEKNGIVGPVASPSDVGQSVINLKKNNRYFKDLPEFQDEKFKDYAKALKNTFKNQSSPANMVAFFSTLIKADVFRDIGKLSEELSIGYGDDDEYCFRAKKSGWNIVIAKGVFVYHDAHSTFEKEYTNEEVVNIQKNNLQIINRDLRNEIYKIIEQTTNEIEQKTNEIEQTTNEIEQKTNEIEQKNEENLRLKQKIQNIYDSKTFCIGDLFFRSVNDPVKIVTFPLNFLRILFRKRINVNTDTMKVKDQFELVPRTVVTKNYLKDVQRIFSNKLKVVCIMDEFTYTSFSYECNLKQLTPENWQMEIEEHNPDLLFIESAWRGVDDKWNCFISRDDINIKKIIKFCRDKKVPTVFWNKEDPVHFDTFLKTASHFDYVFTTDIGRILEYKKILGHERVYLLPFACQPKITNPIEKYDRLDKFCFAGAYYVRYPDRAKNLDTILSTLSKKYDVEIYDRNYGKDDENYQFPKKYEKYIIGTLPFEKIDKAYKGYKFAINMNSIKQSQTMFARRVFEVLASNTSVVSNYSRAVRMLFGNLVISSDNGNEIERHLNSVVENEFNMRVLKLTVLRKVLTDHTYENRFLYICSKVFSNVPYKQKQPCIVAISYIQNKKDGDNIIKFFNNQNYLKKKLILVDNCEYNLKQNADNILRIKKEKIKDKNIGDVVGECEYVTFLNPNDYYGKNYLLDMQLASLYSDKSYIGKGAYFSCNDKDKVQLLSDGIQYHNNKKVLSFACIIKKTKIEKENILGYMQSLDKIEFDNQETLAIDEFSYCRDGVECLKEIKNANVDGELKVDTGIDNSRLISVSESISKITPIITKNKYLILTNIYPSYEDLYRNGFVHARVKAYKKLGVNVDVFKMANSIELQYEEFDNVDVIGGSSKHLEIVLTTNNVKSVLVHFLDENMWNVLKNYINDTEIFVWVHGSEIQHWKRREYNYKTDEDRKKAKMESDKRMLFWRSILTKPHKNLKLVFVSQYFADEVMEDLGMKIPKENYTIIHNCIDTERFSYKKKPVAQRKKILSIRPFASNKYANDLSVKAILSLSKKPFFDELEFRIIGDGILFDEILEPIRHFDNVIIERRFLSHKEISDLHKQYGVFLVPTRMDAQGVSRDEAMSSGLVPVTNKVAAIPEFVDSSCGILADADDAQSLAEGIERLYNEPDLFLSMSKAAADRVRLQTSFEHTIDKELKLFGR